MYTEYFGFNQKPFHLKAAPLSFFSNAVFEAAQRTLRRGVRENHGLVLLTGPAGTGKSMLLKSFMAEMSRSMQFMVYARTTLDFEDLLAFLGESLGIALDGDGHNEWLRQLNQGLKTRGQQPTPVLVVEDAHNLDEQALDYLLYIGGSADAEAHSLRVVAVGLNELEVRLLNLSAVRHGGEGVGACCRLEPIHDDEVGTFIAQQLSAAGNTREDLFPPEAVARVAHHARGVPRNIMAVCDAALFAASLEEQMQISPELVDQAAGQCFLSDPGPPPAAVNFQRELSPADVAQVVKAPPRQSSPAEAGGFDNLEMPPPKPPPAAPPPRATALPEGFGDFDEASTGEKIDHHGPMPGPPQEPRRRGRGMVLLLFLLLLMAGAAGVYQRPEVVGLERAQVDFYADRARQRLAPLVDELTAWWGLGRQFVARLQGETVPAVPEAPDAPAPEPVPEDSGAAPSATAETESGPLLAEATGSETDEAVAPMPDSGASEESPADPPLASDEAGPATEVSPTPEPTAEADPVDNPVENPVDDPVVDPVDTTVNAPEADAGPREPELPAETASAPDAEDTSPSEGESGLPLEQRNLEPEAPLQTVETPGVEEKISSLLAEAQRQIGQKRLTTPADDNALDSYRQILDLSPGHPEAQAGLNNIKDLYGQWAEEAAEAENWRRARTFYERALAIDPDDETLKSALENLPGE